MANYSRFKSGLLRQRHYVCDICGGYADQLHHVDRRSVSPSKKMDPSNVLVVCGVCHAKIHAGEISDSRIQANDN